MPSARSRSASTAPATLSARYEAEHDDYRSIMVKALADRLAEAFAEWLHAEAQEGLVRARTRRSRSEELVDERYRGIRPAFGYPACPDHSEKEKLFELLGAADAGLELTETFATTPAASVSGIYFAHPESRYFAVGRIGLRPGRRLCGPEGRAARRGGALATAEPRLRGRGRGRAMMDA